MTTDTSEAGLEKLITESLVNQAGYEGGKPAEYDRDLCMDRARLLRFLHSTQPEVMEKLGIGKTTAAEDKFLQRLADKIKTTGIVDVMRKGIREGQHEITLYYPQPASSHNPSASAHYQATTFSASPVNCNSALTANVLRSIWSSSSMACRSSPLNSRTTSPNKMSGTR